MSAIGGSIEEISIRGRIFAVTADADITRKLGGFENEVQANGNGTARIIKTRIPAEFGGIVVEVDDSRGDHEFLQDVANGSSFVVCTVSYASGITYQGTAIVTGELGSSSQSATATISLSGPNKFTAQ